jgi:hypothetical protein
MSDTISSVVANLTSLAKRVRKLETQQSGGNGAYASASDSIHNGVINAGETVTVTQDHTLIPGDSLVNRGELVIEGDGEVQLLGTGNPNNICFGVTLGSGLLVPPTGICECIQMPVTCKIIGWSLVAPLQSGSLVLDIYKCLYSELPPTAAYSITASAKPSLSAAQKATSTVLTGWTTRINEGDFIAFCVDSISTIKLFTITLVATR